LYIQKFANCFQNSLFQWQWGRGEGAAIFQIQKAQKLVALGVLACRGLAPSLRKLHVSFPMTASLNAAKQTADCKLHFAIVASETALHFATVHRHGA
jgi:hypothetical protein